LWAFLNSIELFLTCHDNRDKYDYVLVYNNNHNMDVYLCKIMSHVVCLVCQEGFLRVVAEVGIEAEGSTVKFQSLSAAQGRIYRCDSCGKEFVKVDHEFLELIYSKNPNYPE
jgi:hypothetical protein